MMYPVNYRIRTGGSTRTTQERLGRYRSGATVLEVVFAIAITTVGLLGVLTLLPVAGNRATLGRIADESNRVGRNAIHEFDVRHMRRQSMWAKYSGTAYQAYSPGNGESFCIDPLFIATQKSGTWNNKAGYFPSTTSTPRMDRISLWTKPGGSTGMDLAHADQVFIAQDDLVYEIPENDRTAPPEQSFGSGTTETKRQTEGKYSWMVTLAPTTDEETDLYVASFVVFHRRVPNVGEERTFNVEKFHNSGYAGGDVALASDSEEDLEELSDGDWILLRATSGSASIFGWYDVQEVEPDPRDPEDSDSSYTYEVDATLFGRDWDSSLTTTATWVPGVVAVYEKTIRLEKSGMWTEL